MNWKKINFLILAIFSTILILLSGVSWAAETAKPEFSFLRDITVERNQPVSNVITIGGSITIEQGATVTRNALAIVGDIAIEPNAQVNGNTFTLVGKIEGNGESVEGRNWEILSEHQNFRDTIGPGFTLYLLNTTLCTSTTLFLAVLGSVIILGEKMLAKALRSDENLLERFTSTIEKESLENWMSGLLSLCIAMFLVLITSGSLAGFFVFALVGFIITIAVILGLISMAVCLGKQIRLVPLEGFVYRKLWVGMLILWLLSLTPLGGIVPIFIGISGVGAVVHFEDGLWRFRAKTIS